MDLFGLSTNNFIARQRQTAITCNNPAASSQLYLDILPNQMVFNDPENGRLLKGIFRVV